MKDPASFEARHACAVRSAQGIRAFGRKNGHATRFLTEAVQRRHMTASQPSHTRLSSLSDALPHAKASTRRSVTAAKQARRWGGAAHADAALQTWNEDQQRLDMLRAMTDVSLGPRGRSRGRSALLAASRAETASRASTEHSPTSSYMLGHSCGGSLGNAGLVATARTNLGRASRSGLFDETRRSLYEPPSTPTTEHEQDLADGDASLARQSEGIDEVREPLDSGFESPTDTRSSAGKAFLEVPQLKGFLKPRGHAALPGFLTTAGGGGLGFTRVQGHSLLPGRVSTAVLARKTPTHTEGARPLTSHARHDQAGGQWAAAGKVRDSMHRRRKVAHLAQCVMQSRNLARLEPAHPKDLTGEFIMAGAWSQQGLHGAPFRPDTDEPSLVHKYSTLALEDTLAARPPGLNASHTLKAEIARKTQALTSPAAAMLASLSQPAGSALDSQALARSSVHGLDETAAALLPGSESASRAGARNSRSTLQGVPVVRYTASGSLSSADAAESEAMDGIRAFETLHRESNLTGPSREEIRRVLEVPLTSGGQVTHGDLERKKKALEAAGHADLVTHSVAQQAMASMDALGAALPSAEMREAGKRDPGVDGEEASTARPEVIVEVPAAAWSRAQSPGSSKKARTQGTLQYFGSLRDWGQLEQSQHKRRSPRKGKSRPGRPWSRPGSQERVRQDVRAVPDVSPETFPLAEGVSVMSPGQRQDRRAGKGTSKVAGPQSLHIDEKARIKPNGAKTLTPRSQRTVLHMFRNSGASSPRG